MGPPDVTGPAGDAGGSCSWGLGRSVSAQALGVVIDAQGDLLQLVVVGTSVVAAEQQFAATAEGDAHVGLGAASIATIACIEGGGLDSL